MKKICLVIIFLTLIIQSETMSDHSNVNFSSDVKVAYSSSDFIIFDVGRSLKIVNPNKVNRYFGNEAHRYCSKNRGEWW